MKKKIFLIEQTIDHQLLNKKNSKILALSPSIYFFYKNKNFEVLPIYQLFDHKGHEFIHSKISNIYNKIEILNFEYKSEFIKLNLNQLVLYNLYFNLNEFFFYDFIFKNILKKNIINHLSDITYLSSNKNKVLLGYCKFNKIKILLIKESFLNSLNPFRLFISKIIYKSQLYILKIIYPLIKIKYKKINLLYKDNRNFFGNSIFDNSYNIFIHISKKQIRKKILDIFTLKSFFLIFPNKISYKSINKLKNIKKNVSLILKKNQLNALTNIINYDDIENDLFKFLLFKNDLNFINFNAFYSQNNQGLSNLLGQYFDSKFSSSHLISHGSHAINPISKINFHINIHSKNLINGNFTYTYLQTKYAEKYFKKNHHNFYSKPIISHPICLLDNVNSSSTNKNLIYILHASTQKDWKSIHPFLYESVNEYIDNINKIINVIEKTNYVRLLISFRETPLLDYDSFISSLKNLKNISIHLNTSISQLLSKSDFCISYSSTVLEEAIMNDIPCLQIPNKFGYKHLYNFNNKKNFFSFSDYNDLEKFLLDKKQLKKLIKKKIIF